MVYGYGFLMILCILLLCAYFLDVIYAEQIFLEEHVFLDKKHVFNYTVIEILSQYRVGRQ
jgi:hypothetical protein